MVLTLLAWLACLLGVSWAAEVPFSTQQVISTAAVGPPSVFSADLDGDGDLDVLSASQDDDTIAWYENTDGAGSFGSLQPISTAADFAVAVFAADVDGATSVFAADVDRDGDLDVIAASVNNDRIAWYENDGASPPAFIAWVVTVDPDGPGSGSEGDADSPVSVFAADLDKDGDLDVVAASVGDDEVSWFENTDGAGTFGPEQGIRAVAGANPRSVIAADVDRDGDLDILAAWSIANKIAWYENADGAGTFGPEQVISTAASNAFSVFAADVDGDGDSDVLSASDADGKVAWYENTDGAGTFGSQKVIFTASIGTKSVFGADVDGDGDLDVLSASESDNKIAWYENLTIHRSAAFPTEPVISSTASGATSVFAADLDRDGDPDVLATAQFYDQIVWYENTDGGGTFGTPQVISASVDEPRSVYAADLDGDGDPDVLSASQFDDKIAWYENDGVSPPVFSEHSISTTADGASSVFATDLDGDGDTDN